MVEMKHSLHWRLLHTNMSSFIVLLLLLRGRWITRSGQRELDTIASQLVGTRKTAAAASAAAAAQAASAAQAE